MKNWKKRTFNIRAVIGVIVIIVLAFAFIACSGSDDVIDDGKDNGTTNGTDNGTDNGTTNGADNSTGTETETIDTADGSSIEQAITLSITQWKEGEVATGEAKWYKFEAASETSYRVQWKDKYEKSDSDTYTAWIKVTAYQSDGTTKISNIDESASLGLTLPRTVSGVSGTVYLKVEPYSSNASYAGTYTIRFYDPAIVVPQVPMSISYVSATPVPTVVVSWDYSTSGVTGYRLYRSSTETGEYTKIGADITNYYTSSYTDTSVSAGNTYWYKVAAYNSVGEGEKSDAKQSDTVPAASVGTSLTIGTEKTDCTISTATQVDWYTFTAVSGTTYKLQWEDHWDSSTGSFSSSSYTGVVQVSAFKSDGTPILRNSIEGWSYPSTVSGVSGTVYIKVIAYSTYTGTYGIKVYQQ